MREKKLILLLRENQYTRKKFFFAERKLVRIRYLQNVKNQLDIQNKYNINGSNEVFNEEPSKERIIKIAKFIEETEIEKKI